MLSLTAHFKAGRTTFYLLEGHTEIDNSSDPEELAHWIVQERSEIAEQIHLSRICNKPQEAISFHNVSSSQEQDFIECVSDGFTTEYGDSVKEYANEQGDY